MSVVYASHDPIHRLPCRGNQKNDLMLPEMRLYAGVRLHHSANKRDAGSANTSAGLDVLDTLMSTRCRGWLSFFIRSARHSWQWGQKGAGLGGHAEKQETGVLAPPSTPEPHLPR